MSGRQQRAGACGAEFPRLSFPVMAPRFTNFQEKTTVVRIDRPDRPGIDLGTVEYLVTFGGAKDDVGAVIVARPNGFDALTALLRKLPIFPAQVEIAIRVLTSQPSHAIQDVTLTRALLRSLAI